MKKVILLGASGSIGRQCIDILSKNRDKFTLVAAACGKRNEVLKEIVDLFPECNYLYSHSKNEEILKSHPFINYDDESIGLMPLITEVEADLVINALVGFAGFLPSCYALESGKELALANKETLVAGGEFIYSLLKEKNLKIYPIDSEHSAIWQCLNDDNKKEVKKLHLTASGGSFRNRSRDELKDVTVNDALKHPTWDMGAKITIDSATMMNKAFEVMEAHYLFDIDYDNIEILMHKESIVHSLVEFNDGSQLAQLSIPDMRLPIQYALLYPKHVDFQGESLDLAKISSLHFSSFNKDRYPLPAMVKEKAKMGGNFGAVLNGANDEAVSLFLNEKISFLQIEEAIFYAVNNFEFVESVGIEDIVEADRQGRELVSLWYNSEVI